MHSLVVKGSSIVTKALKVSMLVADKIGLKDGRPSATVSRSLTKSYIVSGLEPKGLKYLHWSMEISLLSLKCLRRSVTLSSTWIRWFKVIKVI